MLCIQNIIEVPLEDIRAVSYTHLDVYKRQVLAPIVKYGDFYWVSKRGFSFGSSSINYYS